MYAHFLYTMTTGKPAKLNIQKLYSFIHKYAVQLAYNLSKECHSFKLKSSVYLRSICIDFNFYLHADADSTLTLAFYGSGV
jgi:hypothetical protein